ncbi:MAG: cytochrome c [Betaproteobacteria bacterium]
MAVLVAVGTDSHSADPQQGRLLYETYCGTCHYPKLHDRKSSQVDTVAKLRVEVARWTAQTGRRFTPAEIEDLVDYLNRSHYRLAK